MLAGQDLVNHDELWNRSQREVLRVVDDLGGDAGTHDASTGAIEVLPNVIDHAKRFLATGNHRYADGLRVLIHEVLHGHSPMLHRVYFGAGKILEEATTEMAAAMFVSSLTMRPAEAEVGTYREYIDLVCRTVEACADLTPVRARRYCFRASIAMRRRKTRCSTSLIYVEHFVKSISWISPSLYDAMKVELYLALSDMALSAR